MSIKHKSLSNRVIRLENEVKKIIEMKQVSNENVRDFGKGTIGPIDTLAEQLLKKDKFVAKKKPVIMKRPQSAPAKEYSFSRTNESTQRTINTAQAHHYDMQEMQNRRPKSALGNQSAQHAQIAQILPAHWSNQQSNRFSCSTPPPQLRRPIKNINPQVPEHWMPGEKELLECRLEGTQHHQTRNIPVRRPTSSVDTPGKHYFNNDPRSLSSKTIYCDDSQSPRNISNIAPVKRSSRVSSKNSDTWPESEKKVFDHCLIDSLRSEIEKVKLKLCEIGKRPHPPADTLSEIVDSEKSFNTQVTETVGDFNKKSLTTQLKDLQKTNDKLTRELLQHRKMQETSLNKAIDAKNLLNAYEEKVNTLHGQALKSSKIMASSKEKFCSILKNRNIQIKNLTTMNLELRKTVGLNEEQINELKHNYKVLKSRLKEYESKNKGLIEDNMKFCECIKKLEKELKAVYKDCNELKEENDKFQREVKEIKEQVAEKISGKYSKEKLTLERKLAKSKFSEARLMNEVKELSEKLRAQGSVLEDLKTDSHHETIELHSKYKTLLSQYEALVKKFREYEHFDEIKCNCIEQELKGFSLKMHEKESIILKERDELRALVEELAHVIKQNKATLNELHLMNTQQDHVIENLNSVIKEKENQLLQSQCEIEKVRGQYNSLEGEIENLKIQGTECDDTQFSLNRDVMKDLETTRDSLRQERDNNLIKQKVIDDQVSTIACLKHELDERSKEIAKNSEELRKVATETRRLSEQLRGTQRDLEKEKLEKDMLNHNLEDVYTHKDNLTQQVVNLESAVKSRCMHEDLNVLEQKFIIDRLEKQLKRQRQEWDIQKKTMQKDKEKAIHAARFASQKLLDTVDDFQKQITAQKQAQSKLTIMLKEKDKELEHLTTKVRTILHPDQKFIPEHGFSHYENCKLKQLFPGTTDSIESEETRSDNPLTDIKSCSTCYNLAEK